MIAREPAHPAGEDLAVALVPAEAPLVEPFAAFAQRLLQGSVGGLHEPVERHAHVEDHLGQIYLLGSILHLIRPSVCPLRTRRGCGAYAFARYSPSRSRL